MCSHRKFFPNRALHSLFNRSHCQLAHFELSGHLQNGTVDDIVSVLSDLPTITHLKLEDDLSWLLRRFFKSDESLQSASPIRCSEAVHAVLPRLQSLDIPPLIDRF
jgi:hypothetical protein